MPKNSAWGVNTKAAEAKERKAEKQRSEKDAKQKAIEDGKWKDDNKVDQKKKERKENDQQKKLETLSRKQETKDLLEQEENSISSSKGSTSGKASSSKKVTLSEIDKIKELERKKQQQRQQQRQNGKKKIEEAPELETENPNRRMAEMLAAENAVEARCVDDALSVLNIGDDGSSVDKHPEKRMKAAYNEFEQRELPIIKQENPNLRLSQLKQILYKQWQKSPDNPMNK